MLFKTSFLCPLVANIIQLDYKVSSNWAPTRNYKKSPSYHDCTNIKKNSPILDNSLFLWTSPRRHKTTQVSSLQTPLRNWSYQWLGLAPQQWLELLLWSTWPPPSFSCVPRFRKNGLVPGLNGNQWLMRPIWWNIGFFCF